MRAEAGWYPVALSDDIEPGTTAGTRLFGEEIVVWRDAAGTAHVWADRCPHRGMRLSFGFVRGDHLACLYHGWRFDAGGRCRLIPAHPHLDVPGTITATRFAVTESLGLVWASAGDPAPLGSPTGTHGTVVPVRSIAVDVGSDTVRRALAADARPGEDALPLLTLRTAEGVVHAAIQTLAATHTMVHLVIASPAEPARRARVSLWAEALRRRLEAEDSIRAAVVS